MPVRVLINCIFKNWSEQSACAARVALQTGCVGNIVATKFIVFFHSFFSALLLFSDLDLSRVLIFCMKT